MMKRFNTKIVTGTLAVAGIIMSHTLLAAPSQTRPFAGRIYLGVHLGQSTLKPKPESPGTRVTKKTDTGFKFNAGYQITSHVAVEGFYADLGAATLSTANTANAKVDYALAGLAGVYNRSLKGKLRGLAKLGFSRLSNSSSKGIQYKQIHKTNVFAGLGLEYPLNRRVSLTAEYEHFDKDIQLLNAGVHFRF